MKIFTLILLGMLILPESPITKSDAHPLIDKTIAETHLHKLNEVSVIMESHLECDACMFLANGLNETVLHNPKVIAFVTNNIDQICTVLPQSVQALCLTAANQTAPILLNHLGDFIATEGCTDLGVCHGFK
jgi:hypothetical protein